MCSATRKANEWPVISIFGCRRWLPVLPVGLSLMLLVACDSGTGGGQVQINEPGGLVLQKPAFLLSKTIDETRVEARVSVDVDGVNYPATQLSSPVGDTRWLGEIFVPEGSSDASLNVSWIETGVQDLPDALSGELLLASYSVEIGDVNANRALSVDIGNYETESTLESPRPDLDLDNDGFGNLRERLEGSGPNNASETPPQVVILYNPDAPRIDGRYDSIWNTAQFLDESGNDLFIDNVLIDNGVVQPGEDRQYRWAGMHDGEFLYLLVFGERGADQTPFGDSAVAYEDDAIDIFWDGDNSKGTSYDGVDDYHAIIPLMTSQSRANATGSDATRFEYGDRSVPIDVSAFEFAVCLCTGEQQVYEVKLDLARARIPVDELFGLDIQLNNDVDGATRDAKWAWFNNTGQDDTWRFPIRMGTARLEPEPQ